MHMASMRVRVQPASHGGHYEQYSPFQSAMCKRWDTPYFISSNLFPLLAEVSKSFASQPFFTNSSLCLINNQLSLFDPPNIRVFTNAKLPRNFFPYNTNFNSPSSNPPCKTLSPSSLSVISFLTPFSTSISGLNIPSSQIITAPPPTLPSGITPSKCRHSR